jgi:hypothetical protein
MTFSTPEGQTAAIARATASAAAKSDLLQPLAQHMATQRLVRPRPGWWIREDL